MSSASPAVADADLITHAFIEAGRELGMTLGQLARVIGVSVVLEAVKEVAEVVPVLRFERGRDPRRPAG